MQRREPARGGAPAGLWAIAILSLALNGVIIAAGLFLVLTSRQAAGDAAAALDALTRENVNYTFRVNQSVPVRTDIPFSRTLVIPIERTLDVSTVVTVTRDIPVIGAIEFDVPIQATVPVSFDVPIVISETLPVNIDVPLNLDIPLQVTLSETPLQRAIEPLVKALYRLAGK